MLAALCVVMKIVEMTGAPWAPWTPWARTDSASPASPTSPATNLTENNLNKNNNNMKRNGHRGDKVLFRNMNNNNNNNNGECRRNNLNKRVNNVNNVWRTQHRMLEWHRRKRHKQEEKKRKGLPPGSRSRMTDEIGKGTGVLSPGDLNSNNNGETTASYAGSYVSNTSSQNDADFIQDNSEYQWFLDYGYREGMHHQVSVLSSLSESYARGLLSSGVDGKSCGLYDDLARNLDANLAEVDMENFCAEDIHSLLNTLPTMCDLQKGAENNSQGEMFASMTGLSSSLMGKFDFDSSMSPHSSSQGEDSAGSLDTMSICKSELLFSPVKESAVPGTINFSVDSLDSDIMLTCQANKDNYTIAFEGSTIMGSEDSEDYHDQGDSETTSTDSNNWSRNSRMINPALAAVMGAEQRLLNSSLASTGSVKKTRNGCGRPNCKLVLTVSHSNMARSDSTFTTWSKLKKPETENPLEQQQLSRHPSGNNNTTQGTEEEAQPDNADQTAVKSRSLPNLAKQQRQQQRIRQQIRANLALSTSSSIESSCVKLYDVRCHGSPLTSSGASSCSGSKPAGGMNLVRLFMKQRNGSDHSSSVSDGWDSDSCVRSATGPMSRNHNEWQGSGGISQSCRGKQVFRSCQGVETARNDNSVDECQCLPEESTTKLNNKLSLRSVESLNCGHPRKNHGSWVRGEEVTDCSTCTFEDSLYRLEDGVHRTHEQIAEEDAEAPSEQSESVEQVSESISKINSMPRDSTMENVQSCGDISNYSSHHGHVRGVNKTEGELFHCRQYNVNNNNSLEREDISSEGRKQSRQGSAGNCCCCGCDNKDCRKHSTTQCQLPLINRSMQTSCMLDVLSKATLHQVKVPPTKEATGTTAQGDMAEKREKGDNQTEKGTKPVYVYYPNYALPDLGFLKQKKPDLDLTKVYLRPQKFLATANAGNADLLSKVPACLRKPKRVWRQHRPFSCGDVEGLRKRGFGHVQDWDSLTLLLPKECRVLLADVPEVLSHVDAKHLHEQDLQPLFCASTRPRNRHSHPGCECTAVGNLSTASSTNTQPSSGYRGSSTLLTDSSTQSPGFNPLYVYRYDSVSSEASLLGAEKKAAAHASHAAPPPLPKRSISLPGGRKGGDASPQGPPRPPLPRGILREVRAEADAVSNSKMRKEAANKRFSMFEMGQGGGAGSAAGKRCSLPEPYLLAGERKPSRGQPSGQPSQPRREDVACGDDDEGVPGEHHPLCSHAEFEDVLRLSDYIHLSTAGLSDAAAEAEWDDERMARLRLQVSRLLSTAAAAEGSAHAAQPKAVSFGKARPGPATGDLKTPPNSPNVSALLGNHRQYQSKQSLSDLPIREEDPEVGEASGCSAPSSHCKPDVESKKALVLAVSDAVEEVISHFSGASTPGECGRLGDSSFTPAVANSVIGTLCPALYAVLSDGLLTNIATAFGDISNSVWQVVEASAQQGHMTRSLNELVLRLNSEDAFSEGLLKFNAFVCGLLNVRSVDAWMGYLRTRETILRKHYGPEALLVLSLRGGPSCRALTDGLLAALRPLALLPFRLDLLFECRQLHQSLQRLGAAAATSPTSLLRLVRSIQNSVGQLALAEEHGADHPLPDLLELSAAGTPLGAALKRSGRSRQLRRPRSCVDPALDFMEPSGSLRKRWSGVQLGSKLSQALDRLLAEDAEEDFSDSLNGATPGTPATPQMRAQQLARSDQSTSDDATLASRCSDMEDADLSERSGAAAKARRANALVVGGKFRRLQMKWEKLSGSGTESRDQSTRPSPEASPTKTTRPRASFGGSTRTSPAMSPVKSSSRSSLYSPTASSTGATSRIPRPVTSPVRPPTVPQLHHRSASSPTQGLPGLPGLPPARRPSAPGGPSLPPPQGKRPSTGASRASRADQSPNGEHRGPAARPTSLPYSPAGHVGQDATKRSGQRRANSASVGKPAQPASRKTRPAPRYVRTIKHQLASDSGHLSFSTGERLSLVLEVDEEWLLCCRGDRKGLVRRSAVVATQDHSSRF